jgi:hypothetical protein
VDVAGESPLRYDGIWTQDEQPPAGLWQDGSGEVIAEDGTRWMPGETGIIGFHGTDTTNLVVPSETGIRRPAPITLTPVDDSLPIPSDSLRISSVIGDLEFATMQFPLGRHFSAIAATPYGPVAIDDFALRWSADGVAWEGTYRTVDAWRIITIGNDVIVYGAGYVRYSWDGNGWTAVETVALPGPASHLAFGPHGGVAAVSNHEEAVEVVEEVVYYSSDGVNFARSEAGPDPEQLAGIENRGCAQSGPGSRTDPPQPHIGPLLATEAGFVLVTAAHPDNWSRTPVCEPLLWFSVDGSRWELVSPESPFGARASVHQIAEHSGRYVATGATDGGGAVWVSTDALSWQLADIELHTAHAAAGGELGWIVTGFSDYGQPPEDVDMWFSLDGSTWDGPFAGPAALLTFYFFPELTVGHDTIYGVKPNIDTFVIGRLER